LNRLSHNAGNSSNLPYYAAPGQLDETAQLILGARHGANFTISTHRRDRPGLGTTVPTPLTDAYVAIVQLRPGGTYDMFCDARHTARVELRTATTTVLDLRNLWVADLPQAFHSFSFVIPQSMLDELTEDLGHVRVDSFRCLPGDNVQDPVILNLAKALYPALRQPSELSSLTSAHLFQAACVHLSQSYGGLKAEPSKMKSGLASWQERRVKELMMDSLYADVTIDELSRACDLTQFKLMQAFHNSVGVPAHRWFMERRIESAKRLLDCTGEVTHDIAKFCGFANSVHFTRTFKRWVGVSPDRWRTERRN